jgi:hypothetical protein
VPQNLTKRAAKKKNRNHLSAKKVKELMAPVMFVKSSFKEKLACF